MAARPKRKTKSKSRSGTQRRKTASKSRPKSRAKRKRTSKKKSASPWAQGWRWFVACGLWVVIAVGGLIFYMTLGLPDTSALWQLENRPSITVLDRQGRQLAARGDIYGKAVQVDELPDYLVDAVIATEDRRFYRHIGIDPVGLARAAVTNFNSGRIVQGGSTITQQLAKNLFLSNERTYKRKAQELILALWLEWRFSKTQILSLYLNRVYLGAGTYGVEAASQRYFGKRAAQVTLAEAALLAGLLKAPSRYAPTNNLQASQRRAALVLDNMVNAGFITEQERAGAAAIKPKSVASSSPAGTQYTVDWVLDQLPKLVGETSVDLIVETTLDGDLQFKAQKAVALTVDRDGKALGFSQAALVALTPDGAVRALIGGRSYGKSQFNRAVQAKRQPGSAFKPFVYLSAFEKGLSPSDKFDDRPVSYGGWSPKNYSGRYEGSVTLERAFAGSINTVAVQVAERVGRNTIVRTAGRLGIRSNLNATRSLSLGTSEVSLVELAGAYAPFANGGQKAEPYIVTRIRTKDGGVLYTRPAPRAERVVAAQDVGDMNRLFKAAIESGTGRRARLPARQAGGKTGTSQDSRDAWFVGFTADLVTGVWVGNDDFSAMDKVTGGTVPAVIWKDFMMAATKGTPAKPLPGNRGNRIADKSDSKPGNAFSRLLARLLSDESTDKAN